MTARPSVSHEEAFDRLAAAADAEERGVLFASLWQTGGPVALGGDPHRHVDLSGIVAQRARLRRADLRHADLRGADLSRAFLPQACLNHARLERVRLADADLSHADCRHARMGEADLSGALLEEADLSGASLRFATLSGAALEGANLADADLWGARLADTDLVGANLRGAILREGSAHGATFGGADLRGASLMDVDCAGATFAGADLRGATVRNLDLRNADLSRANLQGVDLTSCNLAGVRWHRAQLDRTAFAREQLGSVVGEEAAGAFEAAAGAYMTLERNFLDLGDVDAASWAYRRKRRMQKRGRRARAGDDLRRREWLAAASAFLDYVGALAVEWICDYGESVGRVFGTIACVFLFFLVLYGMTGSVVRIDGARHVPTHRLVDLALFSLGSMTSNVASPGTLLPSHSYATFLASAQATLSIFLMGLLGFVAGNRIRR